MFFSHSETGPNPPRDGVHWETYWGAVGHANTCPTEINTQMANVPHIT